MVHNTLLINFLECTYTVYLFIITLYGYILMFMKDYGYK